MTDTETGAAPEVYRPGATRARWTMVLLVLIALADVVAIVADLGQWELLERMRTGAPWTMAEAEATMI